jgi:epsilon-lactone hydrolase
MFRGLRLLFIAFWATVFGRILGRPRRRGWPFRFEMIVRYLRLDWEDTAGWDFVRLREDMASRPYPRDFAKKVVREDGELGGVPVSCFVPPVPSKRRGRILFLHGGSYIFGSPKTNYCEMLSRLAYESGLRIVAPDFRLVPEHRYPAQLEDALAVFRALQAEELGADKVVVVGDSSGGNLALALALELKRLAQPQPRALGLISPWCDLEMPAPSFQENDPFDFGTREPLTRHARAFAGNLDLSDPHISPTYADLTGLCPCLVIVGGLELPRDDILSFHGKLVRAGVSAELHVAPEMPHGPPVMAGLHPGGDRALRRLSDYALSTLAEA